jgi:hypothetical protein
MTLDDIRSKIREITNTTTSDYSDASLVRDVNSEAAIIRISILRDRGVLEHDDPNYTDLPVATFAASGTTYKLTEDEDGNLIQTIHKVAISVDGKEFDIPRITPSEGSQEYLINQGTQSVPSGYYEVGKSIVLSHTPTSGTLKIWFDRDLDLLTTSDTTKVPGIPTAYHPLLCYRVGFNYRLDKEMDTNAVERRIMVEEAKLEQYEANRRVDEATVMTTEVIRGL